MAWGEFKVESRKKEIDGRKKSNRRKEMRVGKGGRSGEEGGNGTNKRRECKLKENKKNGGGKRGKIRDRALKEIPIMRTQMRRE